jgi:hypothetical protein
MTDLPTPCHVVYPTEVGHATSRAGRLHQRSDSSGGARIISRKVFALQQLSRMSAGDRHAL